MQSNKRRVIGKPIEGYISYNPDLLQISALYVKLTGEGRGKILDQVKHQRKYLQLWSRNLISQLINFIKEKVLKPLIERIMVRYIPELKFKEDSIVMKTGKTIGFDATILRKMKFFFTKHSKI